MTLETKLTHPTEYLERFRPNCPPEAWHFVASGDWSESPYHAGQSLYEISKNVELNTWVIVSTDLVDPDDEDEGDEGDEGEGAKKIPSEEEDSSPVVYLPEVIAICRDAPEDATIE